MPTGTVLISPVLTDFVVKYQNSEYIGTKILPVVPRKTLQGTFYKFGRENLATVQTTARPHNTMAGHTDWSPTTDTYNCYPANAWREFLPDSDYYGVDAPVRDLMDKAQYCSNVLLLAQEDRIATLVRLNTNYPAANRMQLAANGSSDGFQFNKYSDGAGTLFAIIEAAKAKMFAPMDAELVAWMGGDVYRIIKHHPDIVGRIVGGATKEQPASVMKQTLAELLEVSEILVGDAYYNSTSKKSSATYSKLWGYDMGLFYRTKNPSVNAASFGYTFLFAPGQGDNAIAQVEGARDGYRVRVYRDEPTGGGGKWVEVEAYTDEKLVCTDSAVIIKDAIGSVTPD